jgi:hypothetical protein
MHFNRIKEWLPRKKASATAHATAVDVAAVSAVANGIADEQQQRRAMNWILTQASGMYELNFYPNSDRDTTFALGRVHVGQQIVGLIKNYTPTEKKES